MTKEERENLEAEEQRVIEARIRMREHELEAQVPRPTRDGGQSQVYSMAPPLVDGDLQER